MSTSERRYIAKQFGLGRYQFWGVYDKDMASWPISTADLGMVKQNMRTQAEAQVEADRCEETRHAGTP